MGNREEPGGSGSASVPAHRAAIPDSRIPNPGAKRYRGCRTGSTIRNEAPCPGTLSTSMRPWCLLMMP